MRLSPTACRFVAVAALCTTPFAATTARADIVGNLTCNIAPGQGALIGSQRPVACTFIPAGGRPELYNGVFGRLGLDLGPITAGKLEYQVVEAGLPGPGALQGNYIGAGFGVTVGTGGGLNALIGGNGNAITLQPLAATATQGANVNAGLASLRLQYVGPARRMMRRRHMRMRHRHMRMHHRHHR